MAHDLARRERLQVGRADAPILLQARSYEAVWRLLLPAHNRLEDRGNATGVLMEEHAREAGGRHRLRVNHADVAGELEADPFEFLTVGLELGGIEAGIVAGVVRLKLHIQSV